MSSSMYFGMTFYWFLPALFMGLLVWFLVSLLDRDSDNKSSGHKN